MPSNPKNVGIRHLIRQWRLFRAAKKLEAAANLLEKEGEHGLELDALDLAIRVGTIP
jgi:hypothetical protein